VPTGRPHRFRRLEREQLFRRSCVGRLGRRPKRGRGTGGKEVPQKHNQPYHGRSKVIHASEDSLKGEESSESAGPAGTSLLPVCLAPLLDPESLFPKKRRKIFINAKTLPERERVLVQVKTLRASKGGF